VDSSDSSSFIICGGKRRYFVSSYREISMASLEDYGDLPCNCPICSSKTYEEVRADRSLIALHNLWVLWNELKMVKYAISEGRLEKYLENRYAETPILKSAFEYAKMKRRNFI
jgi:7-cyano-7-deazaguanine tRNA-ribosyltransferase